jgi:hypothetical protein
LKLSVSMRSETPAQRAMELRLEALAWMSERQVQRPERFARALCPSLGPGPVLPALPAHAAPDAPPEPPALPSLTAAPKGR